MGLRTNIRTIAARLMPIRRGDPHTLPGQLVLSLTSHPPRFHTLDLTLRRLLSQDIRPDAVVLWLARGDSKLLPARVTALQKHGLTISECEDVRQYNKIIPSLVAYPDAFVVTADDDIAYPRDWLRRFTRAYRSQREILCQVTRQMVRNGSGYAPYNVWPQIDGDDCTTGAELLLMGCGGAMYPPNSLAPQVTDAKQFMQLCPTADDLWLHWMASLAGTSIRYVKPPKKVVRQWRGSQRVSLWKVNKTENDRQIAAMVAAYGLPHHISPSTMKLNA